MAGRVVIIGDAAAIPRPHTAASTSKAAANALALADELQASPNEVIDALALWEPPQVALGKNTFASRDLRIGDYLLFHRPPIAKIGRRAPFQYYNAVRGQKSHSLPCIPETACPARDQFPQRSASSVPTQQNRCCVA